VSEFTPETALPIPFFLDHSCCDYDMTKLNNEDAWGKIVIQAVLLTLVGTFESLLTAEVVEDVVKTPTDGRRVMLAMGGGNMVCGFFGTMGGNALIGNTTLNVLMGGKLRIGPTITALTIMIVTIFAYPLLNFIPVAALVGLMMIVVVRTFKWFSLKMFLAAALPKNIRDKYNLQMKVPRYEVFAILAVTVLANAPKGTNLAYAVMAGVIISALGYSWRSGQIFEIEQSMEGTTKRYDVDGPLFFASANRLSKVLNPNFDEDKVVVVFGHTTVIDYTALDVLNKVSNAYQEKGKSIAFRGLNPASMKAIKKAAGHFGSMKLEEAAQDVATPIENETTV
jgi:SulP family sulfate permease